MAHRIVLAGGGTAGHVNPLLATAAELVSRGFEVDVLGTAEGLESDLVPAAGFPFHTIPKVPLPRRPSPAFFTLPRRWRTAVSLCENVIRGADCVIGFGGYVSTPAYRAAQRSGIPVAIHEQNARPGLANRVGARSAALVALTFAHTPLRARRGRTAVTGLPLRAPIAALAARRTTDEGRRAARIEAAGRLGVSPDAPTLLITGGSLGALSLNTAASVAAATLPEGVQVIHLTGRDKDAPVRRAIEAAGVADRWFVVDYLTTMEDALAVADLVICRSGAGTVAEMTALGLPCVYVPLPIGNGEQRLNAQEHVSAGGARLINDANLTPEYMTDKVFTLLGSPELAPMAQASAELGRVDAASILVDAIEEILGEKQ